MSTELKINKVEDCLSWLQGVELGKWQSIAMLNEFLWQLSVSLAFVNEQMAVAKRLLNNKKVDAYNTLSASSVANQAYYAPSLAKDYIAAKLEKEQYDYDLCERASRAIVHTSDMARSALSALKEEAKTLNYQS